MCGDECMEVYMCVGCNSIAIKDIELNRDEYRWYREEPLSSDAVLGEVSSFTDDNIILRKAIEKYGEQLQLDTAIEELSELIQAICEYKRKKYNVMECEDNIADEIADVTIMLEQLIIIFGFGNLVNHKISYKRNRLKERLEIST
jgi:NTP pyrophosphatase (non-canonical NTP hydrolase)